MAGYLGNTPAEKYSTAARQTFSSPTGTGFTLSKTVATSNDIALFVNNVRQDPTTYTATGTTLTLTEALVSGDTMWCMFYGQATHTVAPSDSSVSSAKIANDAVSSAKIANDAVTLAKMAPGTDGNIITYDASGNPAAVATGTAGQVLTSAGAGAPPTFAAAAGGTIAQVVNVQTGAVATGTTQINDDDTIPQITEGHEFMTLAITPASASNKLFIEVVFHGAHTATDSNTVALFQDSTAGALACVTYVKTANWVTATNFNHYMTAGTTSATTFKVRAGNNAAGTFTMNGVSSGRTRGGVVASSITITEIEV